MNLKRMALNAPGGSNFTSVPCTPLELRKLKTGEINSYDVTKAKNLRSRAAAMPTWHSCCA